MPLMATVARSASAQLSHPVMAAMRRRLQPLQLLRVGVAIYRVVQKSEATTFEGSDLCMPTSLKCPNKFQ